MLSSMKIALFAFMQVVPAAAHAQEIAGKWTATYPAQIRRTNGNEGAEMGTALMVIDQKGDSIFGTWHAQNAPTPSQPRAFRGTFSNGRLNFVTAPSEARVRRGGDGQTVELISYFEGTLKDGVIEGVMYLESTDQTIRSGTLKWSARR